MEKTIGQMKMIAHRGACLEEQEDTLAALNAAADMGAYAAECDPRYTGDGQIVIFHDEDLCRLAGEEDKISETPLSVLREKLAAHGLTISTLDEVLAGFHGGSRLLLDFSLKATDEALFARLSSLDFQVICGVHEPEEAAVARRFFPPEQILAFMPSPDMAAAFSAAGAGILRLWEYWVEVEDIPGFKAKMPAPCEVWIMSCDQSIRHPLYSMNSSEAQLQRLFALGADGVLCNDIRMALAVQKKG